MLEKLMAVSVKEFISTCAKQKVILKPLFDNLGMENEIISPLPNFPGLCLSGYSQDFKENTLQLFSKAEISYLNHLYFNNNTDALKNFFNLKIPCCMVTDGLSFPKLFLDECRKHQISVLSCELVIEDVVQHVTQLLTNLFAPQIIIHGVLIDVYGIGIVIFGESDIGKSECALSLITRGHRLVADDAIYVKKIGTRLEGYTPKVIKHKMEIKGIGIIDIFNMFGAKAICEQKTIDMVIKLELWEENANNDDIDDITEVGHKEHEILGINVPMFIIVIKPGRHIVSIIEASAMNYRLRKLGMDATIGL